MNCALKSPHISKIARLGGAAIELLASADKPVHELCKGRGVTLVCAALQCLCNHESLQK